MRYDLNGLAVDCDVPLAQARPAASGSRTELTVRYGGERWIASTVPPGTVLQQASARGRPLYCTVRGPNGMIRLRLHGRAEFEITPDARWVRAWRAPGCDPEMLAIFVAGNLVSTVLALRGETVLHASAVEIDGTAVAFVADSGVGKSTVAALCATRGARFVTDDVLRFRERPDGIWCWPGALENRLRRDMGILLGHDGLPSRTSADGRNVWQPPPTTHGQCRLGAVVLPRPDRTGQGLELRRLAPGEAVLELGNRPRLIGWRDHRFVMQSFANIVGLVRSVPVYTARIPWGPPFDGGMIDELLHRALHSDALLSLPDMPQPAG